MPMIRKLDNPSVIWPDIEPSHYSRSVIEWYQQNGVNFVPKSMNPANVPQFRPIEKFLGSMKRELRKYGKIAPDIKQFRRIWGVASRNFTKTIIQMFMRGVRTKLRNIVISSKMMFSKSFTVIWR